MISKSKYILTIIMFLFVTMIVLGGAHTGFSFSGSNGSVVIAWDAWGDFDSVNLNVAADLTTTCYSASGRATNGRLRFRENYSWNDLPPIAGTETSVVKSYAIEISTDGFTPTPEEAGCPGQNGSVVVSGRFNFDLLFIGAQGTVDSASGYCPWSYDSATGVEAIGTCVTSSSSNNGKNK